MSLRCLIIEDQLMFAQLLAGVLRTIRGLDVVAAAHNVADGLNACRRLKPDLVILDITLPDGSGLEILGFLATHQPSAKVIVLSGEASSLVLTADQRHCVRAVVDKTNAYQTLGREISEMFESFGRIKPPNPAGDPAALLTDRELEIFRCIGQGMTSKSVAAHLGISAFTVDTHRRNIGAKLGMTGADLVQAASVHIRTSLEHVPSQPS